MINTKVLFLMGTLLSAAVLVAAITFSVNYKKINSLNKSSPLLAPTITEVKAGEKETEVLNLADFLYPGAKVVRLSGDSYQLKSLDDVQIITDWYKAKINDLKMNGRTFIQTNSNGRVSNQLVGTGQENQVKVSIDKDVSAVTITVLVTNKNDN